MKTDVIIVGGGMVGLAMANALADAKLHITLVERHKPNFNWDQHYALRVSAINAASQALLTSLGVWNAINSERCSPYQHMHVWVDNAKLHFNAADLDEPYLGHIIENRVIQKALWQQAKQHANIHIISPCELTELHQGDAVSITTATGDSITGKWLIAADGANSWVRQQLQPAIKTYDYQQHALVATVKIEKPHQQTAWQRFTESGPLAFLPLNDEHHCSIVWSQPPEQAALHCELPEAQFNQGLQTAFEHKLGGVEVVSPRVAFPLTMHHLTQYVHETIIFIGDAAHRIHPLAGQGVNLGFADVACLAAHLSQKTLPAFQRERQYYNQQMIHVMRTLHTLFLNQSPLLTTCRNLAIQNLNTKTWLKNSLIKHAMGTHY